MPETAITWTGGGGALTANITGMPGGLMEAPAEAIRMVAWCVPALAPVESAVTLTVAGVVPP